MGTSITKRLGVAEDFKGDTRWKVSPSQLKVFSACPRKWGFRYIDGLDGGSSKAAELGTRVHTLLEAYLRDGEALPDSREGKIAAPGLEFLPGPSEATFVEAKFIFDVEGILFRGIVDLGFEDEAGVWISDHKTSSAPERYGLTPPEMPEDLQAITYAVYGLDFWEVDEVGLQWTYFRTRGKASAFPVRASITRDTANENFRRLALPIARDIVRARDEHNETGKKSNDFLPTNTKACGDFGGCPHAEYCERSPDERITAVFGEHKNKDKNNMGLKGLLAAKRAKTGAPKTNGKKQAPPRAAEIKAAQDTDTINAPEKPANVAVERVLSRGIGKLTGNAAGKKAKAKQLTDAVAGITSAIEATRIVKAKLEELEAKPEKAAPKGKSPTQAEVLVLVAESVEGIFASTSAKATDEQPFVNGRTLAAMKKKGLINYRDNHPTPGVRMVRLSDIGRAALVPEPEPSLAARACEEALRQEEKEETPAPKRKGNNPAPKRKGNNPPPVAGTIDTAADLSDRQAFAMFLINSGGDVGLAKSMMSAFDGRFA